MEVILSTREATPSPICEARPSVFVSSVTLHRTTRLTFHLQTRLDKIFKAQDSRLIATGALCYIVIDFLFAPNPFGSAARSGGGETLGGLGGEVLNDTLGRPSNKSDCGKYGVLVLFIIH